jgi:Kef-type K+ transport system membrane component KefB
LAQKASGSTKKKQTEAEVRPIWWTMPALAAGVIGSILFPYLHVHFGSTSPLLAGITAVINIAVFLITYYVTRSVRLNPEEGAVISLLRSLLISLPVFILGIFGLGFEIGILADIAGAYIAGIWIGSSEVAERMHQATQN